jgi:YfiH family protein
MNLGRTELDEANVQKNFELLQARIGCTRLARCSQVHGTHVEIVGDDYPFDFSPTGYRQADGLVTILEDVALVIRVADCVPVLFADARARVIGAAHAGREGLLTGILQATLTAMGELGASAIHAWIGPHVCVGCYEVPEEMARKARAINPATLGTSHRGTAAIDLRRGVGSILEKEQVVVHEVCPCTSCETRYFSHRRDQGNTGRQAGVIWLKSASKPRVATAGQSRSGSLEEEQ